MLIDLILLLKEYRVKPGKEAEGIARFLRLVSKFYPNNSFEYAKISQAIYETQATLSANAKKKRKNKDALISHQIAIAVIILMHFGIVQWELIVASILHDNVEDFGDEWNTDRIGRDYGWKVATLVFYVTKPPLILFGGDRGRRDASYHALLMSADIFAIILKLADRIHNLITIWAVSDEKRIRKVEETLEFYIRHLLPRLLTLCKGLSHEFVDKAMGLGEILEEACAYGSVESDFTDA